MLWPLHGSVTSPEEVMPKGTCAPAQPAPEHPQPARNKAIPATNGLQGSFCCLEPPLVWRDVDDVAPSDTCLAY